jgi:hypothetical protein
LSAAGRVRLSDGTIDGEFLIHPLQRPAEARQTLKLSAWPRSDQDRLAEDMTKAVSESLAKRGFKPTPVIVVHTLSEQQAKQALAAKQAERSILILIKKWESDTYMNIGLDYDLRLMILGSNQTVLAETSAAENKTIPGSFWDPPSAAKEQIPIAFKQVLEKLLNDPKVIAALK